MKQDTNFSAAWKQVAGSRTTATRQTKQSILSSTLLRTLLFLTLMVMGANGAWGDTFQPTVTLMGNEAVSANGLCKATFNLNGASSVTDNRVGNDGNTYYKLAGNNTYINIVFSANGTDFRFMPGDVVSVTMTAGNDNATASFSLKSESRVSEGKTVTTAGDVVTVEHTLAADEINANGSINIYRANGGYNLLYREFKVTCVRYGVDVFVSSNDVSKGTAKLQVSYAQDGETNVRVNTDAIAVSVKSGSNVEFTATPASGKLFWYWKKNGVASYDGANPLKVYGVTENLDYQAIFTDGIYHYVYTNDSRIGTVKMTRGGNGDYTQLHVNPGTPNISFVATEVIANSFEGWYTDVERTTPAPDGADDSKYTDMTYKLNDSQLNSGLTLFAKFTDPTPYTPVDYEKPTCNGTTNFNPDGLIAGQGAKYNSSTHEATGGGYISIKFKNALNFTDLSAWKLSFTNASSINHIDFVNAEGNSIKDFYSNLTDRTVASADAAFLKGVKEFRIYLNGSTSTTINGISLTFTHRDPINPTLIAPTKEEMVVYAGEPIVLKNTSGYWREWNSDYTSLVTYTITDNEYNKEYTLNWGPNDYYFEVKDVLWCGLGEKHQSEAVRVHAKVLDKAVESYDLSKFPGTPVNTNVTNVENNGSTVTVTTKGDRNNALTLYSGLNGVNGTGIRVDSKGVEYRLIVKTTDGQFVAHVPASDDFKTQHFTWSQFIKQWGTAPMTDADVAKVTDILIAGNDVDHPEQDFTLRHLWIDNIADYEHTYVCYGEEDGSYNGQYVYNQNGGTAGFTLSEGGKRDAAGCLMLQKDKTLTLTPPSGCNYNNKVRIIFDGTTDYNLTINSNNVTGNAAYYEFDAVNGNNTIVNNGENLPVSKILYSLSVVFIDQSKKITSSDETRDYWLYVPENVLNGTYKNVPVLFSLHGTNNDYNQWDSGVQDYRGLANTENFIVVNPRGKLRNFSIFGANDARGWDSDGTYNNDVKFFEAIIDELARTYSINQERIYITGFSNGGMMTYQTAFTSKRFAGFAAVGGYPLNEFHLQHYGDGSWQGSHPVPFMHIHGSSDATVTPELVNTIVDNMVYRNGCELIPATTNLSNATKYEYAATGSGYPFVYYNVTGGTHTPVLTINETSSKSIIWDFLKTQTRMSQSNYDGRKRMEFNTGLEVANFNPEAHGWKRDLENKILWQYGEGSGYTSNIETKTGGYKEGMNVYHSLQFGSGWHNMQFTSSTASGSSTVWVKVKLERLGMLSANADGSVYTSNPKVIFEDEYNIGDVSFNFNDKDLGGSAVGEYRLTFEWRCSSDTDPATAKTITISNASIVNGSNADYGVRHTETPESGFEGYIPYEKRLIAQWNFDLCDGARFNRQSLGTGWSADNASKENGIITYTYTGTLNNEQLTYGNSASTLIPIFAGLKFKADANKVKVQVYVDGGAMQRIQLVLEPGVQITVPYVRNTFRNNEGNNGNTQTQYEDYNDCLHHINRDILYVSSSPDFFDAVQNNVMNDHPNDGNNTQNTNMFHTGGLEIVKGAKYRIPSMQKANYCGEQGAPCTITIRQTVTINRIGVNRNMVGSFYTEYIPLYYKDNEGNVTKTKPEPGLRYVASPYGSKVESEGYYGEYTKAIAMTFGGWTYNGNKYEVPVGDSGKKTMTDSWGDLNVYHGDGAEGNQNYNINQLDVTKVPLATDGFPVYSRMDDENVAYSENVNPTAADKPFDNVNLSYHDKNYGGFYLSQDDKGSYKYVENLTPWSLPCRGAFVKFEPTYPGVLNVHILQEANQTYYIADEFGKLVKTNVFTKTGTGQSVSQTQPGHFSVSMKDNVKYTFDVYPGKSYYLFSNTASMGFTGFYFEPYVFMKDGTDEIERYDVGIKTATLKSTGYTGPNDASLDWDNDMYTYTNQTSEQTIRTYDPNKGSYTSVDVPKSTIDQYTTKNSGKPNYQPITYDNRAVRVICERQFTANTWGTICLPYSMNHLQLEDVFGTGAKVVLMRDVQEYGKNGYTKTTANFIYHMNQDIIAGYPYLVYPTKDVTRVESNAYLAETAPSIVTINGVGQNTVTHPGSADYKTTPAYNYDGLQCFDFKGNFEPETLDAGSYVVATDGHLTRLPQQQTAAPFRAFLKYIGEPGGAGARGRIIETANFGELGTADLNFENTSIDDILLQSGIVGAKTDVYSINGQMIRKHTDNLQGLKKGLYIVNGKKYFVK